MSPFVDLSILSVIISFLKSESVRSECNTDANSRFDESRVVYDWKRHEISPLCEISRNQKGLLGEFRETLRQV